MWLACLDTNYAADPDGKVPALITPNYSFLRLAILLHGQEVRGFKSFEIPKVCYADTRSLIKFPRPLTAHEQADDPMEQYVANARIEPVSPVYRGVAVQRVEKDANTNRERPVWDVLRAVFDGDDFWPREGASVWNANGELRAEFGRGETVALLSPVPFEVAVGSRDGTVRRVASAPAPSFPKWQSVIFRGSEVDVTSVRLASDGSWDAASFVSGEAVLPDYMSQTRKPH